MSDLTLVAITTGALAALIAARHLPIWLALALAAARVSVPCVYFGWYFDYGYSLTFLDDLVYVSNARTLLARGYNPLSVIYDPAGWDMLHSLSHGNHVMGAWWNLLAMWLFGDHYHSAVFCNVLATFACGWLLVVLLEHLNFPRGYRLAFLVFWLLHWDVVAWSSLLNVKDVLVLTLTIAALVALVSFYRLRRPKYLVMFALVAASFFWLRFYVPVIMLMAALLWTLTQWNDWRRYLLVPPLLLACAWGLPMAAGFRELFAPQAMLYGAVRFTLTPRPWDIDQDYAFLLIPAALHWLLFLPACLGALVLWRDSKLARLCLLYVALLIALYAMTEELLGPRQRFQITFVIAWAQFHCFWLLARAWSARGVVGRQALMQQPRWAAIRPATPRGFARTALSQRDGDPAHAV